MKCTYCGKEVERGKGKILVQLDGSTTNFCSTKCNRNWKIRSPRKVRWTEVYRTEVKPRNKPAKKASEKKPSEKKAAKK